jgi:GTP-binding protein HflX
LPPRIERDESGDPVQVWISAAQGLGLGLLAQAMAERLHLQAQYGWVRIPATAGALRAQLLAGGAVREERVEDDGAMQLLVELPPKQMAALARNPQVALSIVSPGPPCANAVPYLESLRSAAHTARRRPNPSDG